MHCAASRRDGFRAFRGYQSGYGTPESEMNSWSRMVNQLTSRGSRQLDTVVYRSPARTESPGGLRVA